MTDLFSAPAPTQTPPPSRSRSAQRRNQKVTAAARRRRRRRRTVILFLALVVVGGAGWFVYQNVLPSVSGFHIGSKAKDFPGPGTGTVQVRVEKGDTGTAIARTLLAEDVVASAKAFTDAYNANPASSGIQPGVYSLRKEMKASDVVSLLAAQTGRVETAVTFPEGFTVDQILDRASTVAGISRAEFTKAMKDTKKTGLPAAAKGNYEGWLFPATYSFDPDVTATDIISQMVGQTKAELKSLKVPASQQEEVLIKASIAQKEVNKASDYGKVARVIQNRLPLNSAAAGRLGMDTVLAYGLQKPGLSLTTNEKNTAKTPYNDFQNPGLPPGPISNPGKGAVEATLDPPAGDWLYFVTVNLDTGETKFTSSWQEFGKYNTQFHEWLAAHPQAGN